MAHVVTKLSIPDGAPQENAIPQQADEFGEDRSGARRTSADIRFGMAAVDAQISATHLVLSRAVATGRDMPRQGLPFLPSCTSASSASGADSYIQVGHQSAANSWGARSNASQLPRECYPYATPNKNAAGNF